MLINIGRVLRGLVDGKRGRGSAGGGGAAAWRGGWREEGGGEGTKRPTSQTVGGWH